jgi:hypothetical protein
MKRFELPPAPANQTGRVKAWCEPVVIPTYHPLPADKNPMSLTPLKKFIEEPGMGSAALYSISSLRAQSILYSPLLRSVWSTDSDVGR